MPTFMRAAWPGLVLTLCTAALLYFWVELQPLLGIPPDPRTPNLARREIDSHLIMLLGLAALTASGALMSFALAAFVRRPTPDTARWATGAGWLLRVVLAGALGFLLVLYGTSVVGLGVMQGGEQAFLFTMLTALLGLPFIFLTWTALNRLARWTRLALNWNSPENPDGTGNTDHTVNPDGTASGSLQRLGRKISSSWGVLAALLLCAGLWLLPPTLMDLPHPKAHTVSTLLDKAVIAQQKPLLIIATLALLSAATSAWFTRQAVTERTSVLDQPTSRIGRLLEQRSA